MIDETPDDSGLPNLPATMADIFLALVGVVVIVLLALAPAIRQPAMLAGSPTVEEALSAVTIDGAKPLVLLAEKAGLRIEGEPARAVSIDGMRGDAGLAEALRAARARGQSLLLAIAPDGEETAFVFESLANGLGLGSYYQLRLDAACGYAIDPARARCRPGRAPA